MLQRLILRSCALLCLIGLPFGTQADLLITPKRLILDDDARHGTFHLVNTSNQIQTYEMIWQQLRMDAQGSLFDMGENAGGSVDSLIRLAPKQVSLLPGERQSVRLVPRLPAGLAEGEYMSHLLFRPTGDVAIEQDLLDDDNSGISMALSVRLGFAVPVFLRHGDLSAEAEVRPLEIDQQQLRLELRRTGSASVFGRLVVYWGQPGQAGIQVAQLDGVAVYANLTRREIQLPLTPPEGVTVGPGLLLVRYIDAEDGHILAESTVRLD